MPLDFPTSPTLNEIYTFGGRSWQWNGTAWDVYSTVSGNVVTQLNGLTGGVTLAAGSNITLTPSGNTITIASSGGGGSGISGPYVISFNGLTGAVTGVSSVRGLTGGVGITNGSGIGLSVSGQTMTFSNTGVLSIDGGTGAITNVARTNVANVFTESQTIGVTSSGLALILRDLGNSNEIYFTPGTKRITAYDDIFGNLQTLQFDTTANNTVTLPSINTTLAGLASVQTFTDTNIFNVETRFPGGISGAGATFSSLVRFNAGISSAGGTFSALTRFTAGISAAGATLSSNITIPSGSTLTVNGYLQGITASFNDIIAGYVTGVTLSGNMAGIGFFSNNKTQRAASSYTNQSLTNQPILRIDASASIGIPYVVNINHLSLIIDAVTGLSVTSRFATYNCTPLYTAGTLSGVDYVLISSSSTATPFTVQINGNYIEFLFSYTTTFNGFPVVQDAQFFSNTVTSRG